MELKEKIMFILHQYAIKNLKFNGVAYSIHLMNKIKFIKNYIHLLPKNEQDDAIVSFIGMDLISVAGLNIDDIKIKLGEVSANVISNLNTNDVRKLQNNELILFVKLCDILMNISNYSKLSTYTLFKKYKINFNLLKKELYNEKWDELWNDIDDVKFTPETDEYYPKISKFDEKIIHWIHLPKPIPIKLYDELFSKGVLSKSQLEVGKYYLGKCRNASVAKWDGKVFIYRRHKMGSVNSFH